MKRDADSDSNSGVSGADHDGRSSVALMLAVMDTTWRMFTPSIGFMLLGVWLDGRLGSKPWFTVVGTIFGLLCSVLLVKKQLREIMVLPSKKGPKV